MHNLFVVVWGERGREGGGEKLNRLTIVNGLSGKYMGKKLFTFFFTRPPILNETSTTTLSADLLACSFSGSIWVGLIAHSRPLDRETC